MGHDVAVLMLQIQRAETAISRNTAGFNRELRAHFHGKYFIKQSRVAKAILVVPQISNYSLSLYCVT